MYIHKWLYRLYNLDTSSLHGTGCPCRRFAKIAKSRIRPPSWQKVPRNLPPSFPTHPVRSGAVYIEIFNRRSLPIKYCMILYAFNSLEHAQLSWWSCMTGISQRFWLTTLEDPLWLRVGTIQFNTTWGSHLMSRGVLHTVRLDTLHDAHCLQDQFHLKQAWNHSCAEKKMFQKTTTSHSDQLMEDVTNLEALQSFNS